MSPERLAWAALGVLMLIVSVAIHEFAHAFAAHKLGDDLPESEGRLTLNPITHMDPFGTFLVPVIGALFLNGASFGWGRPVQTFPMRYTRKLSMRAGEALVSFAGPFANLLLGLAATTAFVFVPYHLDEARHMLRILATLNLGLFIFNLLPFPPLDGSKIVAWIFGQKADGILDSLAEAGFFVLLVVLAVAGTAISMAANLAFNLLSGLLSF